MSAKYKVDRSVPITDAGRPLGPIEFPFVKMKVGDSFFVEAKDHATHTKVYMRVQNQAKRHRKITRDRNFSISCRTEKGGFRVWRMA